MLTQEQTWEYNRFQRLNVFFLNNQLVYPAFIPFEDEVIDFQKNFTALEKLVPGKNIIATGITEDKSGIKLSIADTLGLMCNKTHAYALKTGNDELAAQVNNRPDKILKMRDADILAYTVTITDLITPLLADAAFIPYGINALQITDLLASANAFNDMIGKADATSSGNTTANTAINNAIDLLQGNVKQFDLLIDEFEQNNPGFVQGYFINSAVDKTGIRHNGVEGYVTDKSGLAITDAVVQLQNTTKTATTDLLGFYHIDRAMTGNYIIECSAAGYSAQSQHQHIARGRTEELNWQ